MIAIEITVPELPKSAKIHGMMAASLEGLACLFRDHEDDINDALTQTEEGKVTISHSIVIDLCKDKQTDKLNVSIKKGGEITRALYHPDQPDLFDKNGNPRNVTPQTETPALAGLPASVEVIGMIVESETANEDEEEASA